MVRTTIVAVVCSVAAVCGVASGEEKSTRWVDEIVKSVIDNRTAAEAKLKELKATSGKGDFKNVAAKNNAIRELERQIKRPLDAIDFKSIPELPEKPKVGDVGYSWSRQFVVLQVINESEALIEMVNYTATIPGSGVPRYRLSSTIWLEADAKVWTDDSVVNFAFPIAITGTKQYATASGTNTVLHGRTITPALVSEVRKRLAEPGTAKN